MKSKLSFIARILVGLTLMFASSAPISAQQPSSQSQDVLLASVRDALNKAIALDGTVEVSMKGNVLNVSRVNSSLNKTGHSPRTTEAARIGPIVSEVISGRADANNIHTIRVQYLARSKTAAKVVDIIDFRKDARGSFQFHAT
jgi:hypothetical protein